MTYRQISCSSLAKKKQNEKIGLCALSVTINS